MKNALVFLADWKPVANEKHGKHNHQRRDRQRFLQLALSQETLHETRKSQIDTRVADIDSIYVFI